MIPDKNIQTNNPCDKQGLFITFEGGDGCGKTTQIKILCDHLQNMGRDVLVLREPGGTDIGEKIRNLLLDKENVKMTPQTELLLFEASRAQIVEQVIRPAIKDGKVVICDRFYDSSIAYQGYGRGMDVRTIHRINMYATSNLVPDRTLLLTRTSAQEGLKNAANVSDPDRMELAGDDFHNKVMNGFLKMATDNTDRWRIIDVTDDINATFKKVLNSLSDLF